MWTQQCDRLIFVELQQQINIEEERERERESWWRLRPAGHQAAQRTIRSSSSVSSSLTLECSGQQYSFAAASHRGASIYPSRSATLALHVTDEKQTRAGAHTHTHRTAEEARTYVTPLLEHWGKQGVRAQRLGKKREKSLRRQRTGERKKKKKHTTTSFLFLQLAAGSLSFFLAPDRKLAEDGTIEIDPWGYRAVYTINTAGDRG